MIKESLSFIIWWFKNSSCFESSLFLASYRDIFCTAKRVNVVYYLNTEIKHRVVGLCFCNVCPKVENNWKLQEPSVKIKVCLLIVFLKIKPLSKSKIYFRKVENL